MNGTQLTELEQRIRTDYSNIAGMVVRKNGKTVYEGCFGGCTPVGAGAAGFGAGCG